MTKRLIKGLRIPAKPLYLNANLIFSECLSIIQNSWWKGKIRTNGVLSKLQNKGFTLFSSTLTRSEVIQKLRLDKGLRIDEARKIFNKVLDYNKIILFSNLTNELNLTDEFFDSF